MAETIELTADDGHRLAAHRAVPTGSPRGGVVVIQEIFGVNDHIRSVADGFAKDGYLAIAPAMFDRVQRGLELGYGPDDLAKGRALRAEIDMDHAMKDVAAATRAAAGAGKVGIVGYCWGGFVVWMAAASVPDLACAVSYYGFAVTNRIELQPGCPVMLHFGAKDAMIPLDGVERLKAAHPSQQVFVYDEADHGFNCDPRGSYHAPSAKLARERTLSFFRQHIG